ncbi:MAG: TonB family protein [Acidobacteria bacterium]|nr:TonB family protein [Acidobacteriota bacterium]
MPPFQPTAAPVQVKPIWGAYGNRAKALPISLLAHLLVIVLITTVFRAAPVEAKSGSVTLIIPVDINPYLAQLQIKPKAKAGDSGGGGGGGTNSPLPPSKGKLPRFKMEQLAPPQAVILNETPKLAVEPSVVVPPDVTMPKVDIAAFGDPLGKIGLPSNGPGSGGGIGTGRGGGVGSGSGSGVGPGSGGGIGGGAFRVGGGVSAPALLRKVEPEYSEEARKAKYQGTVQLAVEVWPDGRAHNIRVIRSLGLGLDEKAIEAVQQWQFAPGKKDGAPVKVQATIEVNFRLL